MRRTALLCLALLFACRAPVSLPPIPQTVPSMLGPVPIVWVDSLRNTEGRALYGGWSGSRRTIYLRSDLKANPTHAHLVLRHEVCHVILEDFGLSNLLAPETEQALCDGFATYAVAELLQRKKP